jgi:hypothetical protein
MNGISDECFYFIKKCPLSQHGTDNTASRPISALTQIKERETCARVRGSALAVADDRKSFFWLFLICVRRLAVVDVEGTFLVIFARNRSLKFAAGGDFGIFAPADTNGG